MADLFEVTMSEHELRELQGYMSYMGYMVA